MSQAEHGLVADDGTMFWTATSGSGPPMVLRHGGPGLWDNQRPIAKMVGDLVTIHRWDQRGCGRSSGSGPYSIERFVADMDSLREGFGYESWIVGGHSWGATLAFHYAFVYPERVRALVYISGTGLGSEWKAAYEAEVPFQINYECNATLNAEDKSWTEGELLARSRTLDMPVFVAHGDEDPRPVWAVKSLVEVLTNAEFRVLRGVGHVPWLENSASFGGVLRDFLSRTAAISSSKKS